MKIPSVKIQRVGSLFFVGLTYLVGISTIVCFSIDIILQFEQKSDLFGTKFFIYDLLSIGSLFLFIILILLHWTFDECGRQEKQNYF